MGRLNEDEHINFRSISQGPNLKIDKPVGRYKILTPQNNGESTKHVTHNQLDVLGSSDIKTVRKKLSKEHVKSYLRSLRRRTNKRQIKKSVLRWSLPVAISLITVIVLGSNAKAATPPSQAALQAYLASNQLGVYEQIASNGYPEVYYPFDSQDVQLTTDNYPHLEPTSDGQYVTWRGDVNDQTEIFLNDIYTGAINQLSTGDTNTNQSMYQNNVVWQTWDGSNWQIMYYNGIIVQQITDDNNSSENPAINSSQIVYAEYMGNGTWQARSYDISSGQTSTISQGDAASTSNPHFNSDGSVATNTTD